MTIYAVTVKDTGDEIYKYHAEAPIEWGGMEFATHDHLPVVEITAGGDIEGVIVGRTMSRIAFMKRFTSDERIDIREAASQSVQLNDYFELMKLADEVDTADEYTLAGVHLLEFGGLIGEGRAVEILA